LPGNGGGDEGLAVFLELLDLPFDFVPNLLRGSQDDPSGLISTQAT